MGVIAWGLQLAKKLRCLGLMTSQKLLDFRREFKGILVKGQKTQRPKMNVGEDCPNCDGTLAEFRRKNS